MYLYKHPYIQLYVYVCLYKYLYIDCCTKILILLEYSVATSSIFSFRITIYNNLYNILCSKATWVPMSSLPTYTRQEWIGMYLYFKLFIHHDLLMYESTVFRKNIQLLHSGISHIETSLCNLVFNASYFILNWRAKIEELWLT